MPNNSKLTEKEKTMKLSRQLSKGRWFVVAAAVLFAASLFVAPAFAGKTSGKLDTLILSVDSKTNTSITIQVCAGVTGAPAGFSLQWMTKAAFEANNSIWPSSDDPALCKGSFSGNANLSRYTLGTQECVSVNVGEFLFDNGASTNCVNALTCGTEYVFRAFAHASGPYFKSDFTGNLFASTAPCDSVPPPSCTYTQGYWGTHGPDPNGNNSNEWPVISLTLGSADYTDLQLQSILDTSASGNGLIALTHQLIAAKFNIANGADATAIASAIADADALIGNLVVPPIGEGFLAPKYTSELTSALTSYNEGATGPGHCD